MNNYDMFSFEQTGWELARGELVPGSSMTAGHFLTLLESEPEDVFQDAFRDLEKLQITLELSDLPKAPGTGEAALRLRQEEQLVAAGGDLMTGLEENDPLRVYLEEISAVPACGDPAVLADKATAGDENAQAMLVNLSLHRVVELAKEYTGRGVLLMDLIQEGSMGLWQGILNYDGGGFESYRDWWIRHYLTRAVVEQARSCGVGQKLRQAMEDYRAVDERLVSELGRNPTQEEIAEELHMSLEETANLAQMLLAARKLAQASPAEEEPTQEEEAEEQQAVEDTAYFQARQRIAEMLSMLSEEDAKLLSLRFGLEGGLPMTPEEAGRKLGLTPEEVVTREAAALAALRQG